MKARLGCWLLLALGALPMPAADKVDFARDIQPIFASRCYECHGNGKHKGGLAMDIRAKFVTRDGGGHWIVKEGDADGSLLVTRCLLPITDDDWPNRARGTWPTVCTASHTPVIK